MRQVIIKLLKYKLRSIPIKMLINKYWTLTFDLLLRLAGGYVREHIMFQSQIQKFSYS